MPRLRDNVTMHYVPYVPCDATGGTITHEILSDAAGVLPVIVVADYDDYIRRAYEQLSIYGRVETKIDGSFEFKEEKPIIKSHMPDWF